MKKTIFSIVFGLTLFTTLLPIQNVQAVAVDPIETAPVKTIILGDEESSNDNPARVYQKVDQRMNITNRVLHTVANNQLKHWYGQYIKFAGHYWWKVGENQYLKPDYISIVNVERSQELGIRIDNYGNFNNKTGVSMIKED